jgi:hypothetical protein
MGTHTLNSSTTISMPPITKSTAHGVTMECAKAKATEQEGQIPQLLRKTAGSCTGGNELIQLVKPYAVGRQHSAWAFASELGGVGRRLQQVHAVCFA